MTTRSPALARRTAAARFAADLPDPELLHGLKGTHVYTYQVARAAAPRAASCAMNFAFSEEQEELRRITRQFLENKSSEAEVRRLMETEEGYDTAVWSQMAEQMGLQGLIIPEEFGGSGYTYIELTVVLEEMGRRLLAAPYFATVVLAANTLLHSGDDAAKKELLPGIASGETIATVAFTEPNGKWDESGIEATATADGDGYKLNGTKMFVLDGAIAEPDHRRRQDRQGCEPVLRCRRRVGPDPHVARDDGPDAQAGEARAERCAGQADRHRG